jgi:hypothetical protein
MTDKLLTDVLRDWSDEAVVPHDLADRTLAGRRQVRRRRTVPLLAGLATATAVVVGIAAVGGSTGTGGAHDGGPASDGDSASAGPLEISADTTNNPPQDLVAAGALAVAAVVTSERVPTGDGWTTLRRHYALLDPATRTYRSTDWSWVSVAPGLEKAAVLEGDLPASRIGLLDLASGKVTRWVPVDHPVAALVWSPDGSRVLATAYDGDPDLLKQLGNNSFQSGTARRTGFAIVEAASGTASFSAMATDPSLPEFGRSDLSWTHDGTGVFDTVSGSLDQRWRHLDGSRAEPGDLGTYNMNLMTGVDIPLTSPSGRYTITQDSGLPTAITDTRSGEVYHQQALQLLGWADDEHVVTVAGCHSPCLGKAEFKNGLVLMKYDGTDPVPLTGTRKGEDGDWSFQLTPR